MTPRLARADAMLAEQRERLEAVINGNAPREVKSQAWHYLHKVSHWQRQPDAARDLALGELGPNQYGASIDDVVAQAKFHAVRGARLAPKQGRIAA